MAERDLDEAYSMILDILRRHQLPWVAAQVQDQVRAGRPVTRMVAPRQAPMFDRFAEESSKARRPRRERLAATEPYSATERLSLALNALERAVLHTADIEREVIKFFQTEGKTATGVAFEPEVFEDAPRLKLRALPRPRMQALAKLRQALAAISAELARHGDH